MTQHFVIDGNRKLGLNVTIAVEGANGNKEHRCPWGWIIAVVIGIVFLAAAFMLLSGLPYYKIGSVISAGAPEQLWQPRLECRYDGWQGHRSVWFEDTQDCPSIVFLPWQAAKALEINSPTPVITPSAESNHHPRKPLCFGPAGPLDPDKLGKACRR